MAPPRVSVGLPVYNGERYLSSALKCILGQDFTDFELIISDNASTDSTPDICLKHAQADARIRYYRNETNIGATANYNRVVEIARGEFFKWAAHDDEFSASLISRCLEKFALSTADTVLVFPRAEIIDDRGTVLHPSPDTVDPRAKTPVARLFSLLLNRSYAHPLWGLVRTDALRRTRLMGCIEADHVLLAELALMGNCVEIPEVLYRERRHSGSAMTINRSRRALLAWHDPKLAQTRIILPHWLLWDFQYLAAIRRSAMPSKDRLVCYGLVTSVRFWRWILEVTYGFRHNVGLYRRKPEALASGNV